MPRINILSVFFAIASCVSTNAQINPCNEDDHHPENGGYFIVGVGGESNLTNLDSAHGQKLPDPLWRPGGYYPYGEYIVCNSTSDPFCRPPCNETPGCAQYLDTHTCSLLRFCPPAENLEEQVIHLLPHFEAVDSCDFSEAREVGRMRTATDDDDGCFDYAFEADHELTHYYFASEEGCADGQKLAVNVGDFAMTADRCAEIGLTTPRIRNCDCRLEKKPSTLGEPCRTAFSDSCQSVVIDQEAACCDEGEEGTCMSKLEDFSDPMGRDHEMARREACDDAVPGLCYNEDGEGTDTNMQGSTNCCTHVCSACGSELAFSAQWKPCTSLDGETATGNCGFLSRYAPAAFQCDFSACDPSDHWHSDGEAFRTAAGITTTNNAGSPPTVGSAPVGDGDAGDGGATTPATDGASSGPTTGAFIIGYSAVVVLLSCFLL